MSITEKNTLIRTGDAMGNEVIHYPVTKMECVIGLEEHLDNFVQDVVYFDLSLLCVPTSTNLALAGITIKTGNETVYEGVYGSSTPKRIELKINTEYIVAFTNPENYSIGGEEYTFTTGNAVKDVYTYSETFYQLYGFVIDEDEPDPYERVSYINDNADWSPVFVDVDGDGHGTGGDWAGFVEHLVKPCVLNDEGTVAYYLNRNDQTVDIKGNGYSLTATQNMMVEFTRLWVRKTTEGDKLTFEYAYKEFEGSTCWTWANTENTRAEYIYYPMYKGHINSEGNMKSYPNVTPTVLTTAQEEVNACALNGEGWYPRTHLMHNFLEEMTWLLGKSTNCQTTFGQGYTSNSNTECNETGSTIKAGAFWGYSDYTKDVKFLYIESVWGNRWERLSGIYSNVEEIYDIWVKPYPPFNLTAEGYTKQPYYNPSISGHVSKLAISDIGNNFTETSGSSSTHYCDRFYGTSLSTMRIPFVGGAYTETYNSGVSFYRFDRQNSYSHEQYGCSPHYIPPLT